MTVNDNLDPAMVEWSLQHFNRMSDGGAWTVPRSGMIFHKRGKVLVLAVKMPWVKAMPINEDQFDAQQRLEYEGIKAHFEAAGITVEDHT